jgi:outer membrane receptor protein involved in Fe transport
VGINPPIRLALAALACAPQVALAQAAAPKTEAKPAPKASTVEGVTVTAGGLRVQTMIDRKVYSATADLQAVTGSAADLLNNIPSVSVDADGGLTLRGDANVTILVDGKPSAQFSGAARGDSLLQFPASEIEKIEVLTAPPAEYSASGTGGVINIVTKKRRQPGRSGGVQASLGEYGRFVTALNGAWNGPRLKLSGALGYRRDIRDRVTTDQRITVDPTGAASDGSERIEEHFHRLTPWVRGDGAYELDPRQTVRASFSTRQLTGHRWFDQHDAGGPLGAPDTNISDRHSDGHEWHADSSGGLGFDQKLWRPGETLTLGLQQSITREREKYFYTNVFTAPPGPVTHDDLKLSLDLVKTEISADYDLPLARERELKAGYDMEDDRNRFDNVADTIDPVTGQPVPNPAVTSHFRYHQRIDAAYAQYQAPLLGWRLLGGLRAEWTHVAFLEVTGNTPGGSDLFGLYPSLHLDHAIGDNGKAILSLARRVNRPDPEALNPFVDSQDIHNLRAGNPDLKPQQTWIGEAGYLYAGEIGTYAATLYARQDTNAVTDILKPVAPGVVLATKENLPTSRSGGLEFSASGKLPGQLAYNVSGQAFWAQIDARALGAPGLKSTAGVNLKGALDWRPTPADDAQVTVSRQDKRLTPQGSIDAITIVNLGYRRQIRPDLAFVATVSDLFDGQRQLRTTTTPVLHDVYLRHQLGRVALAGVVFTFGGPAKAKGFEYEP